MPPWMMPYFYPMGTGSQEHKPEDPLKLYKRFHKFLKMEAEGKDKKKDDKKTHDAWETISQVALVLLVSMFLTGPITVFIVHMIEQSVSK